MQHSTLFKLLTENYYKFSPLITNSVVFPSSYTPLRLETMQPEDIFVDVLPVTGETEIAYYKNSETNTIYLWSDTISDFSQICFDYPNTITAEYGSYLTVEQRETVVDWFNVNNNLPIDINEAQIRVKTLKTHVIPGTRTHDISFFNDLPPKDDTLNFKKTTIYTDNYSFFGAPYPGWYELRQGEHTVNVSYSAESLTRFYVGGMYAGLFNAIKTAMTSYINEQKIIYWNLCILY